MRIKCPHCNGKGFSELNSAMNMTCGWCMGQGELDLEIVPTEPLTEQEYLQTCNTEQLAEEIVKMTLLDKYKLYDRMESAEYDIGIGVGAKKVIVEWLKQPHGGES